MTSDDEVKMFSKDETKIFEAVRSSLLDVDKNLKGKSTTDDILKHGAFTREILANMVLTLRSGLLDVFEVLKDYDTKHSPYVTKEDLKDCLEQILSENIPKMIENSIKTQMNFGTVGNDDSLDTEPQKEKHTVIIKNVNDDNGKFTKNEWTTVVKKNISDKLNNVPVQKSILTKDGTGCVFVPDANTLQHAKNVIQYDFEIETKSSIQKKMLPKMKIVGLNSGFGVDYSKDCQDQLKKDILIKENLDFQLMYIKEKIHQV